MSTAAVDVERWHLEASKEAKINAQVAKRLILALQVRQMIT